MLETFTTYLFTFLAVFSLVSVIRLIINFVSALISNPPKKLELSEGALTIYGLLLSYLITYLIFIF